MKILWSVNVFPPEIASLYGIKGHPISWVSALSKELAKIKDIELSIAAPVPPSADTEKRIYNRIIVYPLGKTDKRHRWETVISDFKPDVIHVFGSERPHNLELANLYENSAPIVISIQGIIGEISKHAYAGIDVGTILRNITFRDIVRGTMIKERRNMEKRARAECQLYKEVRFVEGRTDWDRINVLKINPNLKYYHCPRMLREPFYTHAPWSVGTMKRHTIFLGQANQPIKGFHIFLEALYMIKKLYPDAVVNIAGDDIYRTKDKKSLLHRKGYHKYVCKLIKKYDLDDNIRFLGYLDENQIAAAITDTNVVVIPSSIENSSNTLAEGMMLGVPCVASYVGGSPGMLTDAVDGYLYNYLEPGILADRVCQIFGDDNIALSFSEKSRTRAFDRHNKEVIITNIIDMYTDTICEFKNEKYKNSGEQKNESV